MQYDKTINVILLLAPIPIKYLPEGKKTSINSFLLVLRKVFYDAWKFVAHHCANGSYHIKGIDFDQPYSPVAHADSFRINISTVDIHILTAIILYAINAFQNKKFPAHEIVYVSTPPYYLDWFERYYPKCSSQ